MAKTASFLLLPLFYYLFFFFFATTTAADTIINTQMKVTDNPADELVEVINTNRTAHKSSSLYSNQGLACIALQYIKAYQGDCKAVGGPKAKKPFDSEFAETFAPACGVQVSTLSPITGRLLGCQSKYAKPPKAFSEILMENQKSLDILYSKNHTEVGAAVSGSDGGGPYFWCVLFSSGKKNSSFVLDGGVAKVTKPGCFSGANDVCNGADDRFSSNRLLTFVATILVAVGCVFGL
ncbi:hypothetical protein F8388_014499 [Cannabis sativa]|uniref:Ferredoxin-like protein n=1 Tax=Cannabis sativa TaxID=3483 RepID=A0A7J6E3X4_CANSA|nr:hypothetical protein G4B88_007337 [Cannabis sativa]KAF4375777.1 hypothetical protein F8388_014499 [Cannabis sativa]